LIKRLEGKRFQDIQELRTALRADAGMGLGKWLDLAGMLAPEEAIAQLLGDIESGAVPSLEEVDARFAAMHADYPKYEWTWAVDVLQKELHKSIDEMTAADIVEMTNRWKKAVVDLDNQLSEDAKKEFSCTVQTGFGVDGDSNTKHSDFAAVRGTFEADGFVAEIRKHIAAKTALAGELLSRIEPLRARE
jgi:hypothetical protein